MNEGHINIYEVYEVTTWVRNLLYGIVLQNILIHSNIDTLKTVLAIILSEK